MSTELGGDPSAPSGNDPLTVALKEFDALRSEIDRRSADQGRLVALALTLGGIGLSLGLTTGQDEIFLILVPILSASFGTLWLDHASQIEKIGTYIQIDLTPQLRRLAGSMDLLRWEERSRKTLGKTPSIWTRLALPILIIFLAPAALGTARGVASSTQMTPQGDLLLEWPRMAYVIAGGVFEFIFVANWIATFPGITRPIRSVAPGQ